MSKGEITGKEAGVPVYFDRFDEYLINKREYFAGLAMSGMLFTMQTHYWRHWKMKTKVAEAFFWMTIGFLAVRGLIELFGG